MIKKFKTVSPNIFQGGSPSPKDVEDLSKKGIKKIVSLDQKSSERISKTCKLLNIKHVSIPLDGSPESLLKLFKYNLKDLLEKDGPVFVHCSAGKDRVGFLTAIYKIKYLNQDYKDVFKDLKENGYGINCNPLFMRLFNKILKGFTTQKDVNNADIVSNTRENIGDYRDTYLDQSTMKSIAPFLDPTRQDPWDFVYNPINDQSPTRENYNRPIKEYEENNIMPSVGIWNSDSGLIGAGPTMNSGGFIYD